MWGIEEDRALGAEKRIEPPSLWPPPGGTRSSQVPVTQGRQSTATAESAAGLARFDDGGRVVVGRRLMPRSEWCAPSAMLMATSVSLKLLHSADAPAVDETVREDDARGARARGVVKPPNIDERARLRRRAERALACGKPREAHSRAGGNMSLSKPMPIASGRSVDVWKSRLAVGRPRRLPTNRRR